MKKGQQSYNYVVNGDFEDPSLNGYFGVYSNISGWTGHDIEIGMGKRYNEGWKTSTQICELDSSTANAQLNQNITLKIGRDCDG